MNRRRSYRPRGASLQTATAVSTSLPWVGILGALASVLFAFTMTPERAGIQGALVGTATAVALCLAVAPVLAGGLSPRNFFRTENVIALCPIYWVLLDLIQASYEMPGIQREQALKVFQMIGIYYLFFWFAVSGRGWTLPKALVELGGYKPTNQALMGIGLWMFVLGMLSFAIPCKFNPHVMFLGLLGDRWSAPWARGAMGGWNAFTDHLAYFGYLLPTIAAMLFRRNGWSGFSGWLTTALSVVFFAFVAQGGSRRILGACVMSAIIFYLLDLPKLKKSHLFIAAVLMAGLLWVMQIMLVGRNIGYRNVGFIAEHVTDSMTGKIQSQTSKLAVDDNFFRMAQLASVLPSRHPYSGFQYITYVLARPIPRVLWKNKPIDGGFTLGYLVNEGASLSTTLVGELYMSYGLIACAIGGWLIGKLAGIASALFVAAKGSFGSLIYGYITTWLLVGFRSMQELMLFSYPLLALIVLSGYIRNFTRADS